MHKFLNIYQTALARDVLGFGNRMVIWVAGCPFSCHGCIEEKLQPDHLGNSISVADVQEKIYDHLPEIDGITFSGGEPLWQSDSLITLFDLLPSTLDKMVFTGYVKSELNKIQRKCFNYFDLVVDGRFVKNKMGNFLWRGSSNQKFYSPTGKYSNILDELYASESAGLDIQVEKQEMFFYGIPTKNNEIDIIKNKIAQQGVMTYG